MANKITLLGEEYDADMYLPQHKCTLAEYQRRVRQYSITPEQLQAWNDSAASAERKRELDHIWAYKTLVGHPNGV